jgi:hypothetical protein
MQSHNTDFLRAYMLCVVLCVSRTHTHTHTHTSKHVSTVLAQVVQDRKRLEQKLAEVNRERMRARSLGMVAAVTSIHRSHDAANSNRGAVGTDNVTRGADPLVGGLDVFGRRSSSGGWRDGKELVGGLSSEDEFQ